jgi:hypothetical protein
MKPDRCPECNRCGFGWLLIGECDFCRYKFKEAKK